MEMGVGGRIGRYRGRVLGEESLVKLLLWLAAPMVITASVNVLYEVADTFWLSRLGEAALAVPSVAWPYRGLAFSLCFGLASGLSALVGQFVGAGDFESARRSIGTVASVVLGVAVAVSLLLIAATPVYMRVMGVPPSVAVAALGYTEVTVATVPFAALYLLFNFSLSAAGDTRTPTFVGAAAAVLNAVLDPVFMFLLGFGVLGAAYATLAASMFSGGYSVYSFATGRHGVRLSLPDLVPDRGLLRSALHVSLPVTAQMLGMTSGFAVMVGVVSGLGAPVIAAYSIGQVMLGIDRVFALPLTRATGIVVGQSLGAGLRDRARRAAFTGLALVTGLAAVYIGVLMVFSRQFVSVFARSPDVVGPALRMLYLFGPSILAFHVFMLSNSVARSSGHTFFVSAAGLARLWLLRIPLSWLLAYRLGLGDTGLWLGMAASNYATGAACALWLVRGGWLCPVIRRPYTYGSPG